MQNEKLKSTIQDRITDLRNALNSPINPPGRDKRNHFEGQLEALEKVQKLLEEADAKK